MPRCWGKTKPLAAPGTALQPQGLWTVGRDLAGEGGGDEEETKEKDLLHRPLLLIRITLSLLGIVPYSYNSDTHRYVLNWRSWAGLHTIGVFLWLCALLVSTSVGIVRVFVQSQFLQESGNHELELMGVVIIVGCLLNAWVEVINVIILGRSLCNFLNLWQMFSARTSLDPTRRLRFASCVYAIFLYAFVFAVLVVAVLGPSDMLMGIVDLLTQVLFLVSPQWLAQETLAVQVVRVVVALVVCHLYMVYKGSLFLFVSICHMLHNVLEGWRNQLSHTLHVAWQDAGLDHLEQHSSCQVVQLDQLVQSHCQVVMMVRKTETIFSSTLQCFYATQVVTLCLELYLVAYRIGVGTGYYGHEAIWQAIIISQTCIVFFLVSLKASRVCEEAERCVDVLRHGLPYTASDKDKFHFGELTVALTSSPICISGGRFFTINRPFIITVVGAVLSYFVIVLQLKLPSASSVRQNLAALNTTTFNHTL
ncbi:hypothetical protein OTU49_011564 [Cherax quadricarinatus]|uniref:Gustatory receptor n=1 Tax=Cherax quadricarinatus TaxID=27406 RepID=A0AAW0W3S0_CHEQU